MFFVVTRFNENIEWVRKYTNQYLVYNKGNSCTGLLNWEDTENVGGNQRDVAKFAFEYYSQLPELILFCQGHVWDHCLEDVFKQLIQNDCFTPIEHYTNMQTNAYCRITDGYEELNNSWYIQAHNFTFGKTCPYESFDQFMDKYFINYTHLDWIRFSPGSNYLVPKQNILKYSKNFWLSLMHEMDELNGTTAHIVERFLLYCLRGDYEPRII